MSDATAVSPESITPMPIDPRARVVLFDIDGTLLLTGGAGRRAMEHALRTVFGKPGDPAFRYDGKTDRQIVREQMRYAGVADEDILPRFEEICAIYLERLDVELDAHREVSRHLAGVPALLDRLSHTPHVTLGLLTGNIRAGAEKKLAAVGLDASRFRVGAYGGDHEHRPMLPAVAQQRAAQALGAHVPGEQFVIIGDTPADIHCGRSLNVRSIGVATGSYSVEELASHEPHAVFATLEHTDAVVAAIVS
jgi:phosphoglycolate phosphatase-like HAD superfamily hydrolase